MKIAVSCIPVVPGYKHSSKQSQRTVMLAGFVVLFCFPKSCVPYLP